MDNSHSERRNSNGNRWLIVAAFVALGFTALDQVSNFSRAFFQNTDAGQVNQRGIQENTGALTKLTQALNEMDLRYSQRLTKVEDRQDTNTERIKQSFDLIAGLQSSVSELKTATQILSSQVQAIAQRDGVKQR